MEISTRRFWYSLFGDLLLLAHQQPVVLLCQGPEDDDVVDPVQEFRTEGPAEPPVTVSLTVYTLFGKKARAAWISLG